MPFSEHKDIIRTYIQAVRAIDARQANEHTYRTPLENLINQLPFKGKNIVAEQEVKGAELDVDGTPDFFVYDASVPLFKSLIGFIECKKISRNIEEIVHSEQILRYAKTAANIIITNYRDFILLQNGKIKARASLINADLSESIVPTKEQDFINLLLDFYGYDYPYIKTKKNLVRALASQSFYYSAALRNYVSNPANNEQDFFYKFNELFKDFQHSLNYDYDITDFCDIYAQSFVYGLFLARMEMFEQNQKDDKFHEDNPDWLNKIPLEYRLLYEFLSTGYTPRYLPASIHMALINIAKNINLVDIGSINQEFIKQSQGKGSITAYLYEDFLKEYDKLKGTENRKESGVYYTPKEATHFIVRSVQEIIKTVFKREDGFLDRGVKVLDFACGTGTFLDSIYELLINKNAGPLEQQQIKNKILQDIYGFELLFTPYIVAHTVLTKFLKDNGIAITHEQRLPVYLTNTLDLAPHAISQLLPYLKQEHEKALKVKQQTDILAVVGNPPYFNGKSKSAGKEIDEFTQDYKTGLNEKKINLDDLYIKFIRFAEWKINKSGSGVAGLITNNSFLDGVTHRQMRKHLLETFDEIYVLNLHGNTRKKEQDQNIFDIMVGVCITLFIKRPAQEKPSEKKVFYYSTKDNGIISRAEKLDFLENHTLLSLPWKQLQPQQTPFYWFTDKDLSLQSEYEKFWKLTDVFENYNSGIESKNDSFTIRYHKKEIENIVSNFQHLPIEKLTEKYPFPKGVWTLQNALKSMQELAFNQKYISVISYRPMDIRHTFINTHSGGFIARPRYQTCRHLIGANNVGLCFERNTDQFQFSNIFVSAQPIDGHLTGGKTYIAPLFLYENEMGQEVQTPNFTGRFRADYYIGGGGGQYTPPDILNYIYGVLHCPIYRRRYIEFLKTDFPRIPFTRNRQIFDQYAALGAQLIALHTMRHIPKDADIREEYEGEIVNFVIAKITPPTASSPRLVLQTTDGKEISFHGVTPALYQFQIGSYAPVDKWLKYRKKDAVLLGLDDLIHIKNMLLVLKRTMSIMQEIEALGGAWIKDI